MLKNGSAKQMLLLIEPCGIEIERRHMACRRRGKLLIEPCGIEIAVIEQQRETIDALLIEPCGIEIRSDTIGIRPRLSAFNRTLWN